MQFVFSLVICLSLAIGTKGQFCCSDLKTQLTTDQVCDGKSDCPMTETSHGGEDEEGCEGSGPIDELELDELDWCKTAEPAGASNTIGITTFAMILPALLSVLRLL